MTEKLTLLQGGRREANSDVVELLEKYSEDAKAGEISNVAIVAVHETGIRSGFYAHGVGLTQLLGAAEFLKAEMIRAALEAKK